MTERIHPYEVRFGADNVRLVRGRGKRARPVGVR